MRVPEGRIVGVYGGTCVGKTTVARWLAAAVGWSHRDCGRAIVGAARRRGVAVSELPLGVHQDVDQRTRARAAATAGRMVIDGRYLQYVMAESPDVALVELTCRLSVRALRLRPRGENGEAVGRIEESDRGDVMLCRELYGREVRTADVVVDTSELAPRCVVEHIRSILGL